MWCDGRTMGFHAFKTDWVGHVLVECTYIAYTHTNIYICIYMYTWSIWVCQNWMRMFARFSRVNDVLSVLHAIYLVVSDTKSFKIQSDISEFGLICVFALVQLKLNYVTPICYVLIFIIWFIYYITFELICKCYSALLKPR